MDSVKKSLILTFSSALYITLFTISLIVGTSFFILFKKTNAQVIKQERIRTTDILIDSIKNPISQGGYFEAVQRLKTAQDKKQIYCFKMFKPTEYNSCNDENDKPMVQKTIEEAGMSIDTVIYFNAIDAQLNPQIFILLCFVILLLSITCIYFFASYLKKKISADFEKVNTLNPNQNKFHFIEFERIGLQLKDLFNNNIALEREKTMLQIARQLAHDIRSPLEVLKNLNTSHSLNSKDAVANIQLCITRIEEISENLLKDKSAKGILNEVQTCNLNFLIEEILKEKRIEYQLSSKILFDSSISTDLKHSQINPGTLKRVISNLINNAIEAMTEKEGRVLVSLTSNRSENIISVEDNGVGVPLEIQSKIFSKGFTTKSRGNGLGLSSAAEELQKIGGKIEIHSIMNEGTKFYLYLPSDHITTDTLKVVNPSHFEKIIVIDDDLSFLKYWTDKFLNASCTIESYSSFRQFQSRTVDISDNDLLICDYDLANDEINGIEVLKQFSHISNRVLATARSNESDIQAECHHLGIKLLGKHQVSRLIINSPFMPIILIDDDIYIHLNWKNFSSALRMEIKTFFSIEEFLNSSLPSKETFIFIDSSLRNDIKGEVESKKIYDLGFINLYITTGFNSNDLVKPSWIKEIYSKDPSKIIFQL